MRRNVMSAALRELPVLKPLFRWRYRQAFRSQRGTDAWLGDFPSFSAAADAAPTTSPTGYATVDSAAMYDYMMARPSMRDYSVLFWLERVLSSVASVFDVGGHVGIKYYAFRDFLETGATLQWTVCDVPPVVAAGKARARELGATRLAFTTDFDDAAGSDVLLALGSLQYIEEPLAARLSRLPKRPPHIIVNQLPTADREVLTLQNIGIAYCPYRIERRGDLPSSLTPLGYEVVDSWQNPGEVRTEIPFADSATPIAWLGYCFRLR
jgi:putative methyltransferase (TIGR04325 family)